MAGLMDFLQSASNSAASNVSAPVDGLAWLLRKAGVPMPQNPLLGSDWMAEKGLTKPVAQSASSLMGETAGMLAPFLAAAKAPQIAKGLLQMGENAATPSTLDKQAGVILYHGSNNRDRIPKILGDGQFQGLFASTSQQAAKSHGKSLYRMTIPDDAVMTMGHQLPESSLYDSVAKNMPYKSNPDDIKRVADLAGSGKGLFEINSDEATRLASIIDPVDGMAGADWTLQRIRGQVAKDHGFKAVEMPDEHGISHLVLPGTNLRPANEQSRRLARGLPSDAYAPAPLAPIYPPAAALNQAPEPFKFVDWMKLSKADKAARVGEVVTTSRTSIGELSELNRFR